MNAWFSFVVRYMLIGIVGTVLIVAFVPTPGALPQSRPSPAAASPEPLRTQTQRVMDRLSDTGKEFANLVADLAPELEPEPTAPAPAPPARSGPPPAAAMPTQPHVPAHAPTRNPTSGRWGVVTAAKASYYESDGSFRGHLPPGTLLDILDIKTNKGETLAICRLESAPDSARILVRAEHLDVHPGELETLSYELTRLYAEQARLRVEIGMRAAEMENRLRPENPHARAFAQAKKAYLDYWQRVRTLQKGRDTAEGADRIHYGNELRKLKGRDITLQTNLEQAQAPYDEWNRQHPATTPVDAGIDRLTNELERIGNQIEELASAR